MELRTGFWLANVETGNQNVDQQDDNNQSHAPIFGQRGNEGGRTCTREGLILTYSAESATDPTCFVILQEDQTDQDEAADDMDGYEEPVQDAH